MKITLATKITIARIFLIIPTVIVYVLGMVFSANYAAYVALMTVACFLFIVLCATDFVDGHIARKTGTVSDLGKFLDPIADKVVVVIMLFLVIAHRAGLEVFPYNTLVISLCGGLILSRELIVGAFRSIAAKKGLVLAADIYGKVKTVLLDISLAFLIMAGVHEVIGWMGTIVYYAGAVMTVVSGLNYILKNKSVLVDEPKKEEVEEDTEEAKAE
ncbi:MAG: CDP-diacylglycerol--glycerol-3-phosphate 3-phosphatidyltransferase [Clostridia bacterium]|nr:CDP-diacylglycerol--glycerol-3-phosphate 3-phosphatidyltransferase [Clostridia bacterium]